MYRRSPGSTAARVISAIFAVISITPIIRIVFTLGDGDRTGLKP